MKAFNPDLPAFDQTTAAQLEKLKMRRYSDRDSFYQIVRKYVLSQLLLSDQDGSGDDLIGLAQASLQKMQRMDPALLRRLHASGCRQSTAVIDKKTALIGTLEKELGLKISLGVYPSVKTVRNLSDTLYALAHPGPVPSCPAAESAPDIRGCKRAFPLLGRTMNGHPLVYLDSAATTQKPDAVIRQIGRLYAESNANVHRSNYRLGLEMTQLYEDARTAVQALLHAESRSEIIFTAGATDAVNLAAFSFGEKYVRPGDEIIVTQMEHHSNFVPWQELCRRKGAVLKMLPVLPDGTLAAQALSAMLGKKTRLLAVTHVSNAIGTVNPIRQMAALCRANGTAILVDASQSVPHLAIDVRRLGCDFLVFSGHKLYGPTGIGVLYANSKWLAELPPYRTGGIMIDRVTAEETTYNEPPYRFEAGTPNYIGAVGLHAAIRFLQTFGMEAVEAYESTLLHYALEQLSRIQPLHILGSPHTRAGVLSFFVDGIRDLDLGIALDKQGIAVRVGSHCAQPLLRAFARESSVRISLGVYNTMRDIDLLCEGIQHAIKA